MKETKRDPEYLEAADMVEEKERKDHRTELEKATLTKLISFISILCVSPGKLKRAGKKVGTNLS